MGSSALGGRRQGPCMGAWPERSSRVASSEPKKALRGDVWLKMSACSATRTKAVSHKEPLYPLPSSLPMCQTVRDIIPPPRALRGWGGVSSLKVSYNLWIGRCHLRVSRKSHKTWPCFHHRWNLLLHLKGKMKAKTKSCFNRVTNYACSSYKFHSWSVKSRRSYVQYIPYCHFFSSWVLRLWFSTLSCIKLPEGLLKHKLLGSIPRVFI